MRLTSRLFASFTIAVFLGIAGTVVISTVVMNDMLLRLAGWRLESASGAVLAELADTLDEIQRNGAADLSASFELYQRKASDYLNSLAFRDSFEFALFSQNGRLLETRRQPPGTYLSAEDEQSRLSDISIWGPKVLTDRRLLESAGFHAGPGSGNSFVRIGFFEPWKWYVAVWIPEDRVWAPRAGFVLVVLAFVPVALFIALSAAILLGRGIVKRIRYTLGYLQQYKSEGFREPIPPNGTAGDEIEELRLGLNDMVRARADSEKDLSTANNELSRLNERLHKLNLELENRVRERTNQLIETEKLAYLGGLVAGISHEVNTPIGTSFTAVTFMHEKLTHLQNAYKSGVIERGDFERTLADLIESSGAIRINLERAAELLQGFKQVAADQIADDLRVVELSAYLEQIHISLKPRMKRTPYELIVDCQLGLNIKTSPGALSQVITNLVENSIIHGFDGRDRGRIEISAGFVEEERLIRITCTDDGAGISPENLTKIFHPFFTTKRGTGGTGLGLHIVYNIVTGKLGGSIHVHSEPGKGTTFTLELPSDMENDHRPIAEILQKNQ